MEEKGSGLGEGRGRGETPAEESSCRGCGGSEAEAEAERDGVGSGVAEGMAAEVEGSALLEEAKHQLSSLHCNWSVDLSVPGRRKERAKRGHKFCERSPLLQRPLSLRDHRPPR